MLELEVVQSESNTADLRSEILSLCNLAYREDLTELFRTVGPATHVLGLSEGMLVSHALWVTRWLQPGAGKPLKTAYVEAVATLPKFQRRGFATLVMRRLVSEIPESFKLTALCPARSGIYERLGWRFWRGRLSIRMPSGQQQETPDERVMVFDLPGGPTLDLTEPLSAEWREGELW